MATQLTLTPIPFMISSKPHSLKDIFCENCLLIRASHHSGLEADQKVLAAHGCYAMTSTTALTVQNTKGVTGVHVIPSDFVGRQIEACLEDVGADVIKTGEFTLVALYRRSY